MALPFAETHGVRDSRTVAILAKSIYRELRDNGFHAKDAISLAGELLSLVASDVRSRSHAGSQSPSHAGSHKPSGLAAGQPTGPQNKRGD